MTTPTTSATMTAKALAAALAVASAGLLAFASFSGRWAEANLDEARGNFGLRVMQTCVEPDDGPPTCVSQTLYQFADDAKKAGADEVSSAFPLFGWIASVALWIAIVGLVAGASLMLAGKFVSRPMAPTTLALLALGAGLIAGGVFVAQRPGHVWMVAPGFWAFAAGEIIGIIATMLVARIRPRDPEWDDPKPFNEETW
jgi:hypothetical protein